MARRFNGVVINQVRTLFEVGAVGSMTDGELLDRFLESRDHSGQAAFGVLVNRHGPMVFGVCRGFLKASHDCEDAFQATFLVLARKASSIRNRQSIAPWLFGVAKKVSARAQGNALRDRRRERESPGLEQFSTPRESSRFGEFEALLSAVDQLPARLREPVVLCYWRGLTYGESAQILGLTEGTIRGRLARARELLRVKLARRGITPETMVSGVFLSGSLEAVPLRLVEPTIQAAVRFSAGNALSGIVRDSVLPLTHGARNVFLTTQGKLTAGLAVAVIGLLGLGSGVLALQRADQPQLSIQSGEPFLLAATIPVAQSPKIPESKEDPGLSALVDGKIVRSAEVTKDCMVLSYLPDWGFGNVDNIGFEGHDGGVRTLVNWPDVPASEAAAPAFKFYLAFYSRKTQDKPRPGSIVALEIASEWPEATSWKTRPYSEAETVGTYKFEPGDGWKVFEITPHVRARQGKAGHGLMFRYINEDRPGGVDWTGYQIVSREATDKWAGKRPRLLVVERRDLDKK